MNVNINYGCGENKLEGFLNVDIEESTKPDFVYDIRKGPFPWNANSVDKFYAIHVIEHIEYKYWKPFFNEIHKVLKKDGELVLAYPEFEICARNYIENYRGMRDFWRATLYGRQLYPGDYHITPVTTSEIVGWLTERGFKNITHVSEDPINRYHTFLRATKDYPITNVELKRQFIFGDEFKTESKQFKIREKHDAGPFSTENSGTKD